MIATGCFSPTARDTFAPIVDALLRSDHYLVLADFAAYVACQDRVDALYRQPEEWNRAAVLNVAGMGVFSSDRTVLDYARQVWGVTI